MNLVIGREDGMDGSGGIGGAGGAGSAEKFDDVAKFGIFEVAGDDKFGRKVIIFNAVKLPSNKILDGNKMLRYLKSTLDRYVANDYIIVYFHFGLKSHNKPPFSILKEIYYELGASGYDADR